MIPRFNKNGYLPKGVHKATIKEVKRRFGTGTPRREELFRRFEYLVEFLRKHKKTIKRFILNGSYVTSKENPGDFDYILIVKDSFDIFSPQAQALLFSEEIFGAHMLFVKESDTIGCRKAIDFFSHNRGEALKGLVEVIL
jgi:hypothetical protein